MPAAPGLSQGSWDPGTPFRLAIRVTGPHELELSPVGSQEFALAEL